MFRKSTVIAALVGAPALAIAAALPAQANAAGSGTLQEVPAPASGSCADYMSPGDINWAGVGAGSWAETFENKCVRTMWYDNSKAVWFVR
ncbi:MAG TPA: hypothetical protein VIG24_05855 [Acidimicrobiia bacterium]